MVRLAVRVSKFIKGSVFVQTNPYYSYSQEKTVVNALRTLDSKISKPCIPYQIY